MLIKDLYLITSVVILFLSPWEMCYLGQLLFLPETHRRELNNQSWGSWATLIFCSFHSLELDTASIRGIKHHSDSKDASHKAQFIPCVFVFSVTDKIATLVTCSVFRKVLLHNENTSVCWSVTLTIRRPARERHQHIQGLSHVKIHVLCLYR